MRTVQGAATARRTGGLLAALALVAAGCGADPAEPGEQGYPTELAGICPDPVVVQTNWWPQAEHAALYQLLGEQYSMDTERSRTTGPIISGGRPAGVDIEIRVGGPAIDFAGALTLLYEDPDITLSMAATDDAIASSAEWPAVTVVAPLDITPQMIMWDPGTYPEFNTVVDIGLTDTTVLYSGGAAYMEYLTGSGILRAQQIDGGYDGNPDQWLAADGAIAQQGFATNEPFIYEHNLPEWNRPVRFQLVHHLGYPVYGDSLMVRVDRREELAECLSGLVPMLQQAMVDYVADPGRTNQLIVDLVDAYQGYPYSIELADFTREQMLRLEIVSNGHNDTLGDLDLDRVQDLIDKATPIYLARRVEVAPDLTPEDLVTNEFIDPAIGLP